MSKILLSGINKKGLTETLDEAVVHNCKECPYNHIGGQIMRYRRYREGGFTFLSPSSSSIDYYFKCTFNEKDCRALESETRKASRSSIAPIRSLTRNYEFVSKRKIINQQGLDKLMAKLKSRIK